MKREILCLECKTDFRKQFPSDNPYPGEHIKTIPGAAKEYMLCDGCGDELAVGCRCFAVSIWSDRDGIAYHEWETEFISEG